jgi:SAM-dependent methyltransferase/LmbE family N-acetylglucosaminyl deacetylase
LSEQGVHIFFSPHADDVVLSCGGAIHSLLSQGKPVEVIGVFAGIPREQSYSALARHLHAKWHLPVNPVEERWREDSAAMGELGITKYERWDFFEAPYRIGSPGYPLYAVNEQLVGSSSREDRELRELVAQKICSHLDKLPEASTLYFPLSLGDHVDHRMLFGIGLELCASGKRVRFYEDYPYAEKYRVNGAGGKWRAEVVPIAIDAKTRAACAYASQVRGLGGSPSALKRRLHSFGASVGGGRIGERYWGIEAKVAEEFIRTEGQTAHPLARKKVAPALRDFGKFLKTFRWHDLDEVLPVGDGPCLDVGCGSARHQSLVAGRGYTWLGIDHKSSRAETICSDAAALPVMPRSIAAVIAWQVLEYVERPELVIAEAARVLEPGGVFCGSVSFLEPVHGRTCFNLSPLILERLLVRHGFADIEIKPGLNRFALMLWTWLRRTGIPFADSFAIPVMFAMLAPLAALIFSISWLRWRCGLGSNHEMRWLTQTAPLEFAGHVLFVARKGSAAL